MKGYRNRTWRGYLALLLCGGMLFGSAGHPVLAAEVSGQGEVLEQETTEQEDVLQKEEASEQEEVLEESTEGKQSVSEGESTEEPFGAFALSAENFSKRTGDDVELKVYAWSTRGALSYTWYHAAGQELENNSDTLRVENLQNVGDSDFGTYICEVSDGVSQENVEFQVNLVSDLKVAPAEGMYGSCMVGKPVNLAVTAYDYGNPEGVLTYQWYRGKDLEELLEGQTTERCDAVHQGENLQSVKYTCVVSNGADSQKCEFSVQTYQMNISFTSTGGSSMTRKVGSKVTLYAEQAILYPDMDLSYQWYVQDSSDATNTGYQEMPGETSASLSVTLDKTGYINYRCDVKAQADPSKTGTFSQSINVLPTEVYVYANSINLAPIERARVGRPAKLTCIYSKADDFNGTITYQWYKVKEGQEEELSGETGKVLRISSVKEEDYGEYHCKIDWGSEDGSTATYVTQLSKSQYGISQSAYAGFVGDTITYSVTAPGEWELVGASYQWYFQEYNTEAGEMQRKNIQGATEREYQAVLNSENASRSYYCDVIVDGVVYQAYVSSGIKILDKNSADWDMAESLYTSGSFYWIHKFYKTGDEGDENVLLDPGIVKGDNASLEFQWERGINDYSGGISTFEWQLLDGSEGKGSTYDVSLDEIDNNFGRFRLTVTDKIVPEKTRQIEFYVSPKQTISMINIGGVEEKEIGESVTLHVEAKTTEKDLTYQWEKYVPTGKPDDPAAYQEIPGATGEDLIISNLQKEDYGQYYCRLFDGYQTVRYSMTICSPATQWNYGYSYNDQPIIVHPGQKNLELSLENELYKDDSDVTYTWYQANDKREYYTKIPGSSGSKYLISEVTTEDCTYNNGYSPYGYGAYRGRVTINGKVYTRNFNLQWLPSVYIPGGGVYGSLMLQRNIGDSVTLQSCANAEGDNVTYQWFHSRYVYDDEEGSSSYKIEEIPGATDSSYALDLKENEDFGAYQCKVNVGGVERTLSYYINQNYGNYSGVRAYAGNSRRTNKYVRAKIGETVQAKAVAYCSGHNLTYQWEKDEYTIPGANQPEYDIAVQSREDYTEYCCNIHCEDCHYGNEVTYYLRPDTASVPTETPEPEPTPIPTPQPVPDNPETAITGIVLDKEELSLKKGETAILTASSVPAGAENVTVTFSSSNPKIVSVDEAGLVTAKEKGKAVVTAMTVDGRFQASCSVEVSIPANKVLMEKKKTMVVKDTYQLKATLMPVNSTDHITWKSSNESIASVNAKGKVTAKKRGTVDITAASSGGKKAVCKITVVKKKIKAAKIKLDREKAKLNVKDSLLLSVTMNPKNSTDNLKWSSSKKNVATVDKNGVVIAKKPGKTVITVKTDGGKKASCTIEVKQPTESIEITGGNSTLKRGKKMKLKAKVTPGNSTDSFKWKSSNSKIASVKADKKKDTVCEVKGLKKGKVTITVQSENGKKASYKITVK